MMNFVPCYTGETANFILQSKTQLLQDFMRFYGDYFRGQESLFDQFYEYLANSVITGDSTDLPSEFIGVRTYVHVC